MSDSRGTSTTQVIFFLATTALTVFGLTYGATARAAADRMERGLEQEKRINTLEQISAGRTKEMAALREDIADLKNSTDKGFDRMEALIRDHMKTAAQ